MAPGRWCAMLLVLATVGCRNEFPPPVLAPAPPPFVPPPAPAPSPLPERGGDGGPFLPTRLFVQYRQQLAANYGAVALILFRNAEAGTPRLKAACAAYVRVLDEAGAATEFTPPENQMVMIWPVRRVTPALSDEIVGHDAATANRTCRDATLGYDFGRMSPLRVKLAARNANLRNGRGPWIVAWSPGRRYADSRAAFVVMDLSRFDNGELEAAFEAWSNRVQSDPNIYRGDWNRQKFPELAAWWLNRFGAKALGAFKLVASLAG